MGSCDAPGDACVLRRGCGEDHKALAATLRTVLARWANTSFDAHRNLRAGIARGTVSVPRAEQTASTETGPTAINFAPTKNGEL